MLGSQFHPEFKSRPNRPHPLFRAFVEAAIAYSEDGPSSKPQVTPVAQLRLAQSQTA
jgi:CTP synthase